MSNRYSVAVTGGPVRSVSFWVNGKRYRGSIPEARVKAQAERAEDAIRDQVYEGTNGRQQDPAPLLRDFITDTFLPWSKANKRTWVHDEFRSRPLIEALGSKTMDEILPILIEKYKRDRRASKTARGTERAPAHSQPRVGVTLQDLLLSD